MGLRRAAQKRPFVVKYFGESSPAGPEHPSALPYDIIEERTQAWVQQKYDKPPEHRVDTQETCES